MAGSTMAGRQAAEQQLGVHTSFSTVGREDEMGPWRAKGAYAHR